jgi:membrane-bound inhibitor of C-type lysozyme
MQKLCRFYSAYLILAAVIISSQAVTAQSIPGTWPSIDQQLAQDRVISGSALDKLIRENQEFHLLGAKELHDKLRIPLWLRIYWRKAHPEHQYAADDPTGGYPRALRDLHAWMITHQNLVQSSTEAPTSSRSAVPPSNELRISSAQTSARSESDIRVNFTNPNQIIAASNSISTSGRQSQFYSSDGGSSWGQTTLPFTGNDTSHTDPAVGWTTDGTAWATTLGIRGSNIQLRSYRSTDGGAHWVFDATASGTQLDADKQLMWIDDSATSPFKDTIYTIWHFGNPAYVNRRNPITGWGSPLRVSGFESSGTAIGGDITTNEAGDVFAFWPATGNNGIFVAKSTDGANSFAAPIHITTTFGSYDIGVPAIALRRALIYASAAAYQNNVYVTWTDLSGEAGCTVLGNEPDFSVSSTCKSRIWFSRSVNGGANWSAPIMINNQPSRNDQFNQRMAVDPTTGTLALVYYDTVGDSGRLKTDLWYQSSSDNGLSWSDPFKITSAMTNETSSGADLGNQYGDYNGLSGFDLKFFPSWTDRRSGGSEEIWSARIIDDAIVCTPPAAPANLVATTAGLDTINLTWDAAGGATEYRIFRASSSSGPYTQIATVVGESLTNYSDTALAAGTHFYAVRAFTTCTSALSSEASATVAGAGDFSLSVAPSVLKVRNKHTAVYTVTITRTASFANPIALSISGLPAGITASFGANPASTNSSTLTLLATNLARRGTYGFTVTGSYQTLSHTASASVNKR